MSSSLVSELDPAAPLAIGDVVDVRIVRRTVIPSIVDPNRQAWNGAEAFVEDMLARGVRVGIRGVEGFWVSTFDYSCELKFIVHGFVDPKLVVLEAGQAKLIAAVAATLLGLLLVGWSMQSGATITHNVTEALAELNKPGAAADTIQFVALAAVIGLVIFFVVRKA